jgi:hypothetical protein
MDATVAAASFKGSPALQLLKIRWGRRGRDKVVGVGVNCVK